MHKYVIILIVCLAAVFGFCQSPAKYRAASILEVVPLQTTVDGHANPVYKISLQTDNAVYVVLYTSNSKNDAMRYAAGMQVPVLVGEKSIKLTDILGQSFEVQILEKRTTALAKK